MTTNAQNENGAGTELVPVTKKEIETAHYLQKAANLSPEQWSVERIKAIQQMYAPAAKTIGVLANFLATAARYDLDPALGEIWLGEIKGKPTVLTGRDSFIKVAWRDYGSTFLGFEADVVREEDEFEVERTPDGDVAISHRKSGFKRGPIIGAYALVRDCNRRPVYVEKHIDELTHLLGKDVWKQNKAEMVLTRAVTFALKLMYPFAGVYTAADEFTEEDAARAESQHVAGQTKGRLEELKGRMREQRTVEAEPEDAEGEDGFSDYEVVEEENQESEYDRARGRYFALCRERGLDDTARKQWQADRSELPTSASQWSTQDYQEAVRLLELGVGFDQEAEAEPAEAEDLGALEEPSGAALFEE